MKDLRNLINNTSAKEQNLEYHFKLIPPVLFNTLYNTVYVGVRIDDIDHLWKTFMQLINKIEKRISNIVVCKAMSDFFGFKLYIFESWQKTNK